MNSDRRDAGIHWRPTSLAAESEAVVGRVVALPWRTSPWSPPKELFDARHDLAGSTVSVTVTKLGSVGEDVEGSFRGVLVNRHGESMTITNGVLRVVRAVSVAGN